MLKRISEEKINLAVSEWYRLNPNANTGMNPQQRQHIAQAQLKADRTKVKKIKERAHKEGRREGIKYLAQSAENIMEQNKIKLPSWWISTRAKCLRDK